jgi:transposase-like protein
MGTEVPARGSQLAARLTPMVPFVAFPPDVRRVICPANAVERVNARERNILKTRDHFPNDDAATKLIWLVVIFSSVGYTIQ